MLENLTAGSYGLVFSQPVLLALVEAGLTRDEAYRIVQSAARQAHEGRQDFRQLLEKEPAVARALAAAGRSPREVLDRAFDLERALQHAHRTIDALEEIDP